MINFLPIAKMFLGAKHPLLEKVQQAQEFAAQFSQNKSGALEVLQRLKSQGFTEEKLNKAIGMLENASIASKLDMIRPGLTNQLKSAMTELNITQTQPSSPSSPSNSSFSDLKQRLSKFK